MKNPIDRAKRESLIDHIEENLWEMWSNFGQGPGCALHVSNDVLWFETPIPIIPYNGVLRFQARTEVDHSIEMIVQHFRRKKAQFMWVLHPSAQPADLNDRLINHGLKYVEPIPGMARELKNLPDVPPLPNGIEVHEVVGEGEASAFYQFAAWRWNVPEAYQEQYSEIVKCFRFGEPDTKAFMWQAWHAGQPIAKAGLYLGSESAGIYAVVTKPEARRQGLARILTLVALHKARSCGYPLAVLHSSPMAEGLYQSLGFSTIAKLLLYASEEVHI